MSLIAGLVILLSAGLMVTPYYFLAPLPGLGLFAFFLFSRKPELGYFLILFLIPFGAYRKLGGGINIPWLLAGLLIIILVLRLVVEKRLPARVGSPLWLWFVLFFAISVVSTLLSDYMDLALENLKLFGAALLFIFFNLVFLDRQGFRDVLPGILIYSVSLGSLLSLLSFYFGMNFLVKEELVGAFARGKGGAIDSNNLAFMITFIIPLILNRLLEQTRILPRLFFILLLFTNLLAVVSTYSRSGVLVLFLTSGMILFYHWQRLRVRDLGLLLALLLMGGSVLTPMIPVTFWDRLASLGAWEDTSLGRRTTYLQVAGRAFVEHPLLGSGPGTFRQLYSETEEARRFERKGKPLERYAHNTYLEVLVGTGGLGLAVFLVILLLAIANFFRAERLFRARGEERLAGLTGSYRISFLALLLFLLFFSDLYHKYLLLSLPLSQRALDLAREEGEGEMG